MRQEIHIITELCLQKLIKNERRIENKFTCSSEDDSEIRLIVVNISGATDTDTRSLEGKVAFIISNSFFGVVVLNTTVIIKQHLDFFISCSPKSDTSSNK
jgi:hypothetical protein